MENTVGDEESRCDVDGIMQMPEEDDGAEVHGCDEKDVADILFFPKNERHKEGKTCVA